MTAPKNQIWDLIIVGAGVAGTMTLVALLEHVMHGTPGVPQRPPLQIVLFERSGEFGAGPAYGQQSGYSALLLSQAQYAVAPAATPQLYSFLSATKSTWLAKLDADPVGAQWARDNYAAIEAGAWETLYLPRFLIGAFMADLLARTIAQARAAGVAEIELCTADVQTLRKVGQTFECEYLPPGGRRQRLSTRATILCIGIPTRAETQNAGRGTYIENLYSPSLDQNLQNLTTALAGNAPPRTVVIIGSSAAALEAIYELAMREELRSQIAKIVVISPSAKLPDAWRPEAAQALPLVHMAALNAATKPSSAGQIMQALIADVLTLRAAGFVAGEFGNPLLREVFLALEKVSPDQQAEFVEQHTKALVRQLADGAGPEYLAAAHGLQAAGVLEIRRGLFLSAQLRPDGLQTVSCEDLVTNVPHEIIASALITCHGFATFARTDQLLLKNCIREKSLKLRVNRSQCGFAVDDNYQATSGLFILGSLLTGISNRRGTIFDLENTSRLWQLSVPVAEQIAAYIFAARL